MVGSLPEFVVGGSHNLFFKCAGQVGRSQAAARKRRFVANSGRTCRALFSSQTGPPQLRGAAAGYGPGGSRRLGDSSVRAARSGVSAWILA